MRGRNSTTTSTTAEPPLAVEAYCYFCQHCFWRQNFVWWRKYLWRLSHKPHSGSVRCILDSSLYSAKCSKVHTNSVNSIEFSHWGTNLQFITLWNYILGHIVKTWFERKFTLHVTCIDRNLSRTDMWTGEIAGMKYFGVRIHTFGNAEDNPQVADCLFENWEKVIKTKQVSEKARCDSCLFIMLWYLITTSKRKHFIIIHIILIFYFKLWFRWMFRIHSLPTKS